MRPARKPVGLHKKEGGERVTTDKTTTARLDVSRHILIERVDYFDLNLLDTSFETTYSNTKYRLHTVVSSKGSQIMKDYRECDNNSATITYDFAVKNIFEIQ